MTEDSLLELRDQFHNDEKGLRDFAQNTATEFAGIAKGCKLHNNFSCNRFKDSIVQRESLSMKEHKVYDLEIPSNPDWKPSDIDSELLDYYELKIGPNVWDALMLYCKILQTTVLLYIESIPENIDRKTINVPDVATCIEEIIHSELIPKFEKRIELGLKNEFTTEFKELNDVKKPEEKKDE